MKLLWPFRMAGEVRLSGLPPANTVPFKRSGSARGQLTSEV
ncbi:hypothetical protein [Deinococcus betulae]|nr:hypothetical protein [Deinococcus betulae]